MTRVAEWRKALAAALTGTAAWGVTAQVDGITDVEWWGLVGVLAGAVVVWLVPNDNTTVDVDAALLPYDPEHTTPER